MPTGSTISARRTWAWPAGSVSATVAPLGTTRCVVSSVADSDGANGTCVAAGRREGRGLRRVGLDRRGRRCARRRQRHEARVEREVERVDAQPAGLQLRDRRVQPAVRAQRDRRLVADQRDQAQQLDRDPQPRRLARLGLEVVDPAGEREHAAASPTPFRPATRPRTTPRGTSAAAQRDAAFGLPTRPGGRCSATRPGVVAKSAWMVTSAGAPACVVDGVTVNEAWAGAARARKSRAARSPFTPRNPRQLASQCVAVVRTPIPCRRSSWRGR